MSSASVTNVIFAGLGGQGVLKASDILAEAALRAGFDVKKSEIHGMSQRGGSVTSDVRFGARVLSPLVPVGEVDFLVALSPDDGDRHRPSLKTGGALIGPEAFPAGLDLPPRTLNVFLLGVLSRRLPIAESDWLAALRAHLPAKAYDDNLRAFQAGAA